MVGVQIENFIFLCCPPLTLPPFRGGGVFVPPSSYGGAAHAWSPRAVIYSSGFQSRSREAQVKSIQPDIDVKDDDDDDDDDGNTGRSYHMTS